ncbi:MAG: hypothetical protein GKR94_28615 [Gammaproteobacteria bacterium]|nr:hypothetical protein [Gammaproteobacteria bacterium]
MFIGVGVALVVPLFLQMIASGLVKDASTEPHLYLVFLGFCVVAAAASHTFIETVTKKLLREVQASRTDAQNARDEVEKMHSEVADNTYEKWLQQSREYREKRQYLDALTTADQAIRIHPEKGRAWAHKSVAAYYLKDFQKALDYGEKAVELGAPTEADKAKYLFNLACYKSHASKPIAETIDTLKEAVSLDPSLKDDIAADEDLAKAREALLFREAFGL